MIYSHPAIYNNVMRFLYGKHLNDKYQVIANLIEPDWSVLDVCCGSAALYDFLSPQSQKKYLGIDNSRSFVRANNNSGRPTRQADVFSDPLPKKYDAVILLSSLYQFIPRSHELLEKMLASAEHLVIISEPIENLSSTRWPLMRPFLSLLTRPSSSSIPYRGQRFTKTTYETELRGFQKAIVETFLSPGGREIVSVFDARLWRKLTLG